MQLSFLIFQRGFQFSRQKQPKSRFEVVLVPYEDSGGCNLFTGHCNNNNTTWNGSMRDTYPYKSRILEISRKVLNGTEYII